MEIRSASDPSSSTGDLVESSVTVISMRRSPATPASLMSSQKDVAKKKPRTSKMWLRGGQRDSEVASSVLRLRGTWETGLRAASLTLCKCEPLSARTAK